MSATRISLQSLSETARDATGHGPESRFLVDGGGFSLRARRLRGEEECGRHSPPRRGERRGRAEVSPQQLNQGMRRKYLLLTLLIGGVLALLFLGEFVFIRGGREYSSDLRQLRAQFNQDKGKVRLLMLLSPT